MAIRRETGTPIDHVPTEAHYSHWVAERAIDFINQPRDEGEEFFLVANFFDPHHPFGAPREFRDKIDVDSIPPPNTREGELEDKPREQERYSEKSYGGTAPGFKEYTEEQIQEIRAQYWAMIALIDYEVGRILAALDVAGLAEDTLVVFSSDHGEMLGNHQQLLKGPQLYDDLTRVPLIARWPDRISPGSDIDELVQWVDLPATFLDAAGCAPGRGVQGNSLLPLMAGTRDGWRNWALCEYRSSGFTTDPPIMTTMLRSEHWKLIIWHGSPVSGGRRDGELYDLSIDPGELQNLFHDPGHSDIRRRLKGILLDVMAETEDRSELQARHW